MGFVRFRGFRLYKGLQIEDLRAVSLSRGLAGF